MIWEKKGVEPKQRVSDQSANYKYESKGPAVEGWGGNTTVRSEARQHRKRRSLQPMGSRRRHSEKKKKKKKKRENPCHR